MKKRLLVKLLVIGLVSRLSALDFGVTKIGNDFYKYEKWENPGVSAEYFALTILAENEMKIIKVNYKDRTYTDYDYNTILVQKHEKDDFWVYFIFDDTDLGVEMYVKEK